MHTSPASGGDFVNHQIFRGKWGEMNQTRFQPGHDPVKKLKQIFAVLARLSLLICLISSISLVLYTTFSAHPYHWLRFSTDLNLTRLESDTLPTNISHIVFGLGGSTATWPERSRYSSVWWSTNLTRGFVWLDEDLKKKNKTLPLETSVPYRVSSPEWTRFKFSSSRSAVRIARIIMDSFKLGLPNVRWFVMGDDDTVFFTDNLVSVLARYDHRQMWYIGGNSESVEQNVVHSYDMAFGGGGFAVSYPLAERLVNLLDGCLDRYYYFYGSDQRIWACISEIGVRLTLDRGFHQFDIRGNPYGLLAAHPLTPLVSLHHLDYLEPLFPSKDRMESLKSLHHAYLIDPPRILQQTFCHDHSRKWTISISWGYTVQLYLALLPANDLQKPLQTFKTWGTRGKGPFTFNTRPVMSDPCKQPLVFMLERAGEVGFRGSVTTYKRLPSWPEKGCTRADYKQVMSLRRIIVSSMKLGPDYWTKAPRRQCCEFIEKGSIRNSGMQIRIRNCRPQETVTT